MADIFDQIAPTPLQGAKPTPSKGLKFNDSSAAGQPQGSTDIFDQLSPNEDIFDQLQPDDAHYRQLFERQKAQGVGDVLKGAWTGVKALKDMATGAAGELGQSFGEASTAEDPWQSEAARRQRASLLEGVSQVGRNYLNMATKDVPDVQTLGSNYLRSGGSIPGTLVASQIEHEVNKPGGMVRNLLKKAGIINPTPEQEEAEYQAWKKNQMEKDQLAQTPAAPAALQQAWSGGAEPLPQTTAAISMAADPLNYLSLGAAPAAQAVRKMEAAAQTASAAEKAAQMAGSVMKTGGHVLEKTGELPETIAEKLTEKTLGPQAGEAAKKLGASVGPVAAVTSLIHGGTPEMVMAGLEGAKRVGKIAEGVGEATKALAEADRNNPFGRLNAIAKDPDAPEWMRYAASSSVARAAAPVASAARDVIAGGLHGGAIGAAIGSANADTPEEFGESVGQMGAFGGAARAATIPMQNRARVMQKMANAAAELYHQHVSEGVSPETLKKVGTSTMMTAAAAQKMFGDVRIRFLDGESGQFAAQANASNASPHAAGFWSPTDRTIYLNADSGRGADTTLLHELTHPLFDSVVANRPELKAQIDSALQRTGKTLDQVKRDYAEQVVGSKGFTNRDEFDRAVNQYIDWMDKSSAANHNDPNHWAYSEVMAEAGMKAMKGKNIVTDIVDPSLTTRAVQASKNLLEGLGIRFNEGRDGKTILPNFEDTITSPELRKSTYSLLRAMKDYRPGIDEPEPQGIKVTPEIVGKSPAAPAHVLPNGEVGSDFMVQSPSGKFTPRPNRDIRKIVKTRRAEVNAAYPLPQTEAPTTDDPKLQWRKTPSGLSERSGTTLGPDFDKLRSFSDDTKQKVHDLETAIANGEARQGWYQQIGEGPDWRGSVSRDTGNVTAQHKQFMPINFHVDKAGNILVRNYSLGALNDKAQVWAGRHGPLSLDLWDGNVKDFKEDVARYLDNHKKGLSGDTGIGPEKRNAINAFLVGKNVTFEHSNPLRSAMRGSDAQGVVRSYRLDRLETLAPHDTEFAKPDYAKQVKNLSPDIDKQVSNPENITHEIVSMSPDTKKGEEPQKTVKAYKLFRAVDGKLYPLFVDSKKEIPMGQWLKAEDTQSYRDPETGRMRVKSKLGDLAYRPGWHAGDLPYASHIGVKDANGNIVARRANEVWAEVEMAADKNYQDEARKNGTRPDGRFVAGDADLDHMPENGYYRYKTNPNMTGDWMIGGNMKVNRVLPEAEVARILKKNGVQPMPWENGKLDLKKLGFNPKELKSSQVNMSPDFAKDPRAIRAAAVRDPETGQIFEGPFHAAAVAQALGLPKYRDLTPEALASFEHGFTTHGGEFLTRSEAYDRAQKTKQLMEGADIEHDSQFKKKGGIGIEHLSSDALMDMHKAQEAVPYRQGVSEEALASMSPDERPSKSEFEKNVRIEAHDHPEVARQAPHLLPQIVKDELRLDPNAYKGESEPREYPPKESLLKKLKRGAKEMYQALPVDMPSLSPDLTHWSSEEGLKTLDPEKYGTGLLGAEAKRKRDYPELFQNRTYFGMKGYKKEPGLGDAKYKAKVPAKALYDFEADPKDLYPTKDELEQNGYAPFDQRAATTLYEKKIKDAGYEGYVNKSQKVAAKFTPTDVTPSQSPDLPEDVLAKLKYGVDRDEPLRVKLPLSNLTISQKALDGAMSNVKRGAGSKTEGAPLVAYENGKLIVEDGMHRIAQAVADGKKEIEMDLHSQYTDHTAYPPYANLSPDVPREMPEDKELSRYASRIAALTEKNGGASFDITTGKAPTRGFSTSLYPDRTELVEKGELTPETIKAFAQKNADLLALPDHVVGTWNDKSSGKTYLDVSYIAPNENIAKHAAEMFNQKAYWDIKGQKEVATSGSGEPMENMMPAPERVAAAKASFAKTQELPKGEVRGPVQVALPEGTDNSKGRVRTVQESQHLSLDAIKAAEDTEGYRKKVVEQFRTQPGFRDIDASDTNKAIDEINKRVQQNLQFLYDRATPENRDLWKQWYDFAHDMSHRWGKEYGVHGDIVAAINARLSPQMEWNNNVTLTRRALDTIKKDPTVTEADKEFLKAKIMKEDTEENPQSTQSKNLMNEQLEALAGMKVGDKMSELNDLQAGMLMRSHNELYAARSPLHDHNLKRIPGDYLKWSKPFNDLRDVVSIWRNPSYENVNQTLGGNHKVRSFYNNHVDPKSPLWTTIDTHATAAANLYPYGGSDKAVVSNFGNPNHKNSGVNGVYPIYQDAYEKVAKANGILPRELQSIIWEQMRKELSPAAKRMVQDAQKKGLSPFEPIWAKAERGEISREEAQKQIVAEFEKWNAKANHGAAAKKRAAEEKQEQLQLAK